MEEGGRGFGLDVTILKKGGGAFGVGRWPTWGSRCRGYVGSVSVLFICWGVPLGDLGLQMSGICGVCICSFYLVLGGAGEEEKERRREVDLRLNSNNPNLKGGE